MKYMEKISYVYKTRLGNFMTIFETYAWMGEY